MELAFFEIEIILLSVLGVSLISLLGIVTLGLKEKFLKRILLILVSFAAGALFGDSFIHLLPEAVEATGFTLLLSLTIILGIVLFFFIERVIHWHHCHDVEGVCDVHRFTHMSLLGDAVHNLVDGAVIAASFIASIPAGIATTVAVALHEIPQEIGDFAILLHGGFTRKRAIAFNMLSALTAFVGAAFAIIGVLVVESLLPFLLAFTAGGFIYIAGSDLIPELHKHPSLKHSLIHLIAFMLGVAVMVPLLLLE